MPAQITTVSRIDGQVARERPAQRLIGGDEGPQTLVDLAIHTFTALLNRNHRKQADTDADQRNDRQAQQGRDERMQRAEIEIAQLYLRRKSLPKFPPDIPYLRLLCQERMLRFVHVLKVEAGRWCSEKLMQNSFKFTSML